MQPKEKGFVKIPRCVFSSDIWEERRVFSRFEAIADIYQAADYKSRKLTISFRMLADRWGWCVGKVQRLFATLSKKGMITVVTDGKSTTITVTDTLSDTPTDTPNDTVKLPSTKGLQGATDTPNDTPTDTLSDTPRAYKNDIIISCLSKNNKNNPPLPPKGYESILFDFVDERFLDILFEWLEFKNDRRERYKNEKSLKLLYKKLLDLSDADPIKARKVVEQSMANNWSGLFELKENKKQSYEISRRNNGAEQTVAAATEAIAELLADNR